ncbi:MAG: aminoglycoside phosphotransferase family protein [Polyangiaceae bacterium]|nr:aminoglycoside phosphotransferase family protein [Polyangiaceae bacterium]
MASGLDDKAKIEVLTRGIERRLGELLSAGVTIVSIRPIAADRAEGELKHVGYGEPLLVEYRGPEGEGRAVFRTAGPNWFGHDRRSDRAALAMLAADTYGEIPDHVRVLDVGALGSGGQIVPLAGTTELYLITTYVEGELYAADLRRIEREGRCSALDVDRARVLAEWLAALHAEQVTDPPEVYHRAIRDLIGSGEGIFGLVDSYPANCPIDAARLARLEQRAATFRLKLRDKSRRLRRTHGDFHPYNVLFRRGVDFSVLDASRGCRGDPADDLAAMSVNYLFGGALSRSAWKNGLEALWRSFWTSYLDRTGDDEVLDVLAPFLAWRLLVVASPVWYPSVPDETRDALLRTAEYALDAPRVELERLEAIAVSA